jgi:hypothetical protein
MIRLKESGNTQTWPGRSIIQEYAWGNGKRATKILNQDNWCPGRNSNLAPEEYKCKALAL